MSSPYTFLMTPEEETAYDSGLIDGRDKERKRILDAVEKMRPYIDENGVNWFAPFDNIIKAIKGENK